MLTTDQKDSPRYTVTKQAQQQSNLLSYTVYTPLSQTTGVTVLLAVRCELVHRLV